MDVQSKAIMNGTDERTKNHMLTQEVLEVEKGWFDSIKALRDEMEKGRREIA